MYHVQYFTTSRPTTRISTSVLLKYKPSKIVLLQSARNTLDIDIFDLQCIVLRPRSFIPLQSTLDSEWLAFTSHAWDL